MDRASSITLTTDASGIRKLTEDPNLLEEFFHDAFDDLNVTPITVGGARLVQLTPAGELDEWWGTGLANNLPWAVALTYGTESGAENYARVITPDHEETIYFEGPADLLGVARAIEKAAAQAQPVDDEALEALKRALKNAGVHFEEGEDAAA